MFLQFCDVVSELPECGENKPAITVTITELDSTPAPEEEERKLSANVSCYCPNTFMWREQPPKQKIQNPENGTITITQYICKPVSTDKSFNIFLPVPIALWCSVVVSDA